MQLCSVPVGMKSISVAAPLKLPPGHYTLEIWRPRHGEQTRSVEIPRKADAFVAVRLAPGLAR